MCSSLRVCAPTACLYRGLSTMGVLHGFVGSTGFQTDDGQLRGVVRVADSGRLGMRPPISKSCPSDLERNTARAQPLQFVALIVVVHQVDATSRRAQLWSSFVKSVTDRNTENVIGTTFSACDTKQQHLAREQKGSSPHFIPRTLRVYSIFDSAGDKTSKLRRNRYGQSRGQQQYGKSKYHVQKGRLKRCQTWQHQREKDAIYHECFRFEGRTRRYCCVWDHISTPQDTSNVPKHHRTRAEREALWERLLDRTRPQNRTCRR